jgi:alkane 1-monooxygenase
MFMAAMLPPLFFSIMDKRVVEWADGDLEKINIFPPAKERIVKKYGEQSETSL